jgi:hypothetical protein
MAVKTSGIRIPVAAGMPPVPEMPFLPLVMDAIL